MLVKRLRHWRAVVERLVFAVYRAGIHEILSGLSRMLDRPV